MRATRVGADTAVAQIGRLVSEAQTGKAQVQRLADRVSAVFVPVVIALSLATLAFWLLDGASPSFALTASVAVLIVACPCALGLATPTALLVGTGRGAQLGIVIKGPEVLESTRTIDTIVLDKTGTVTTGRMALVDVALADGCRARRRPEAGRRDRACIRASGRARDRDRRRAEVGTLPPVELFVNRDGLGVEGVVDGHALVVGRPSLLAARASSFRPSSPTRSSAAQVAGRAWPSAAWDGEARAILDGLGHRQADQRRGDLAAARAGSATRPR